MSSNTVSTAGSLSQVISRADARAQNVPPFGFLRCSSTSSALPGLLRAARRSRSRCVEVDVVVGGGQPDGSACEMPNISELRLLMAMTELSRSRLMTAGNGLMSKSCSNGL